MVIDERSRHALRKRLEEILGPQEAATLMEHLPPVGWADVATKRDLDMNQALTKRDLDMNQALTKRHLDSLRVELGRTRAEIIAEVRGEIITQQRHFVTWMLGANLMLAGLAFSAAKLV